MVDDNIFREVDEELRREQYKALWDKYGVYVVGVAVAVVLSVAALKGWQAWQLDKKQLTGDQYIEALRLVEKDNNEAVKNFRSLTETNHKGYEQLSRIQLAISLAQKGETGEAEIIYKKIINDPSADKILSKYAALQLAILRVDDSSYEEMLKLLGDFEKPGVMWRLSAAEIIALAAFKDGKFEIAKERFVKIAGDPLSPSALKRRAQIMLDVIAAREAEG